MTPPQKWSQTVTKNSHALILEKDVFTWSDPKKIAQSLARSALARANPKGSPLQSAMSMLNFYLNRAGKKLPQEQRELLESVKEELRGYFKK